MMTPPGVTVNTFFISAGPFQTEVARVGKMRDTVQSKLLVAEAQRSAVEQQRDALKAEVQGA